MVEINTPKTLKIIHIAFTFKRPGGTVPLLLRKKDDHCYAWFEEDKNGEIETVINAATIDEAIRLGRFHWKNQSFRTLNCGFRYTLPERDEHGMNALFHQMAASYGAFNGVYFDDELGHNCFVQAASIEARDLWKMLRQQNKI